jgi:hypothetical protein
MVGLATAVTLVSNLGGWLILIEAEDVVQDTYIKALLHHVALCDENDPMPPVWSASTMPGPSNPDTV